MTLGKPGVKGNPPDALNEPTDVVTDPANGDVYVAESHTNVEDPNLVGRISVFDRNGKFLRVIGKTGTGPGEFRTPHAVEFDSQGRLIVADRHNHRIQILTKDGKYLGEYQEFSRVSGLAIDGNDTIYVADSEIDAAEPPGLAQGHSHRKLEGRQGDDVRAAAQDRCSRWSYGRRDRRRCRRQCVHRGSHGEGRDEVRQAVAPLRRKRELLSLPLTEEGVKITAAATAAAAAAMPRRRGPCASPRHRRSAAR